MSILERIKTILKVALTGLTVPMVILNLLGGIISGIWLAVLGEWGEIFNGFIIIVGSGFLISIFLIPSLLFDITAANAMEKSKKIIGMFLGSLSILYKIALVTVWCISIMSLFISSANDNSLIPLLIWSYGVALAVWMWFAQKDQHAGVGEYSILSVFAQISYIIGIIMFSLGATLDTIQIIFGAIMLLSGILQVIIIWQRN